MAKNASLAIDRATGSSPPISGFSFNHQCAPNRPSADWAVGVVLNRIQSLDRIVRSPLCPPSTQSWPYRAQSRAVASMKDEKMNVPDASGSTTALDIPILSNNAWRGQVGYADSPTVRRTIDDRMFVIPLA